MVAIVKVPLASASSQNLSLDHILLTWESFGDQLVADHGVAEAGNHTWVLGQVYTSLEAIVKVPLASASSQNLSLNHILLTWECLGDLLSLIRIASHLEL